MVFPANLTRDEARARARLISTQSYELLVDLTGRDLEQPEKTFVSTATVRFTASSAQRSHIDLIADRVLTASLNGVDLDPAGFVDSRLPFEAAAGANELTVTAVLNYSRSGLGLHRFVDPADQRVYLYSQFETSEARRVFACFEQPDLKASYTVSVLAPADWTVISNGPESGRVQHEGGVAQWDFATTEPISTYLVGVVAGEYAVLTDSYTGMKGPIPMSLLCRRSLTQHLDADRILATTRRGFDVFEAQFDYPYPFAKYDQAFVPEYNIGAMENVGCVTLRDEYLFRSRKTAAAYESRDNTILHELAHMWFGDLVTMRWWDDLWLKESFAEWASHFAQSETAGDPAHAWASFCNGRKTWAYRQDQLPSTHPIAADMVDLEAVELNFDGITYAKGASVLRQLVAFVGRDAFLAGARRYFAEHAFGNTELADLLTALEQPSGRDLSGWSSEWLEKAGVNTLRARFSTDAEGRFTTFSVEQTAPALWPTLRSHRLAIGLYELQQGALVRVQRIETDISGASTKITELVGLRQPDLVLVNDDDLTYAKVRLDDRSLRTLINSIHRMDSPLARAVCWGASWDMCRDAELRAADYVELVLRGVVAESDLTAVGAMLRQGRQAVASYTPPERRDAVATRWETGLLEQLESAAAGSDHQLALARALALAARSAAAADRLTAWLHGTGVPDGLAVDTDLRWALVTALARLGRMDDADLAAELTTDNTIAGAEHAAEARAARPTTAAKADAWALAVDGDDIANETQRSICQGFWQSDQDDVLAPYVDRYLAEAEKISAGEGIWRTKAMSLRDNVLTLLFPGQGITPERLQQIDSWLATAQLSDSVRRIVDERRDDAARALRCQAAG
ncbi:aminopeptidase N [Microlunatus panaciterrae]|uniref:Aminopeptidase N n=1 Tax=Microlunatus panaciterrae TaxID=400768 RepID=A0ABS2RLL1_9ACTN|nr:aminopeptidase N [Microlunatus panaciterrae]MBM7799900.1 aminopeptidase N [Microlunatus panaciterrae]